MKKQAWMKLIGKKLIGKKQACQEQKITEITVNAGSFGTVVFERNCLENEITCSRFPALFGGEQIALTIYEYDEQLQDTYFSCLAYLYDRQEEIIRQMKLIFLECYEHAKEVSADVLSRNFGVERICIGKRKELFYEEEGTVENAEGFYDNQEEWTENDLLIAVEGNHNKRRMFSGYYSIPYVYLDCGTKKMCYRVEE